MSECSQLDEKARRCICDNSKACNCQEQPAAGPIDPNEKLVAGNRFIRPDELLVYPIHFENIGNAEARDVFITDVLDANLDLSTLELLTPSGGSIDAQTRTVRWNLLGRNLPPGATDNVLLSIRPRPGVPSGTVIRNQATIQFEVFSPIITNEVVNVIDSTPPMAVMNPLPPETPSVEFPISWSGTDAVGEIDFYSVFVSVDGGPFTPFLERTRETSATFRGESGRTYRFFAIATDTAGNREPQDAVAEAITRVEGDTIPPSTTATASPGPNANGWNNTDVSVNLAAIDNPGGSGLKDISFSLSGAQSGEGQVAGTSASVTISAEGTTTLTYFATDNAGNREAPKTLTVRIDKTVPVISGLPAPGCTLWPPNHELVQVATVTVSDGLSGLTPGSPLVTGISNEPEDGLGDGDTTPDVVITGSSVQLRAERSGTGTGRVYTLTATASDRAGNAATATATCTVPHDEGKP